MSYLSRGKIGKTGKYQGNGKTRKTKNRVALVPSNLTSSKKKMSELYQTREIIFRLLAASGFFDTTSLG